MKESPSNACSVYQALLQARLDGRNGGALPEPARAHQESCPHCRDLGEAAAVFADVLPLLTPPEVPPALTGQIVGAVLNDRRKRQAAVRRYTAVLAVAASVLVLVGTRLLWVPPRSGPAVVSNRPAEPSPARENQLALRDSLDEARLAVAALTTQTADRTVEPTRLLLPVVTSEWTDLSATSQDQALQVLSATAGWGKPPRAGTGQDGGGSLGEAREGVTAGLEPVTSSARRAVSLFIRDLPMGLPAGD